MAILAILSATSVVLQFKQPKSGSSPDLPSTPLPSVVEDQLLILIATVAVVLDTFSSSVGCLHGVVGIAAKA
jgi:hypothetical protein